MIFSSMSYISIMQYTKLLMSGRPVTFEDGNMIILDILTLSIKVGNKQDTNPSNSLN